MVLLGQQDGSVVKKCLHHDQSLVPRTQGGKSKANSQKLSFGLQCMLKACNTRTPWRTNNWNRRSHCEPAFSGKIDHTATWVLNISRREEEGNCYWLHWRTGPSDCADRGRMNVNFTPIPTPCTFTFQAITSSILTHRFKKKITLGSITFMRLLASSLAFCPSVPFPALYSSGSGVQWHGLYNPCHSHITVRYFWQAFKYFI